MSAILLDDELKAKLNGLRERIEVRDASGKRVGWIITDDEYQRLACLPDHIVTAAGPPTDAPTDE